MSNARKEGSIGLAALVLYLIALAACSLAGHLAGFPVTQLVAGTALYVACVALVLAQR